MTAEEIIGPPEKEYLTKGYQKKQKNMSIERPRISQLFFHGKNNSYGFFDVGGF